MSHVNQCFIFILLFEIEGYGPISPSWKTYIIMLHYVFDLQLEFAALVCNLLFPYVQTNFIFCFCGCVLLKIFVFKLKKKELVFKNKKERSVQYYIKVSHFNKTIAMRLLTFQIVQGIISMNNKLSLVPLVI